MEADAACTSRNFATSDEPGVEGGEVAECLSTAGLGCACAVTTCVLVAYAVAVAAIFLPTLQSGFRGDDFTLLHEGYRMQTVADLLTPYSGYLLRSESLFIAFSVAIVMIYCRHCRYGKRADGGPRPASCRA